MDLENSMLSFRINIDWPRYQGKAYIDMHQSAF